MEIRSLSHRGELRALTNVGLGYRFALLWENPTAKFETAPVESSLSSPDATMA